MKRRKYLILLVIATLILSGCNSSPKKTGKSTVPISSTAPSLSSIAAPEPEKVSITLGFAGDICFADPEQVMISYRSKGNDISKCIDPEYIKIMKSMDIMWINNEFCYSDRGSPMPGKAWTFRSKPENVSILKELGVDIVGLANNHIFDYGEGAFFDTLSTLKGAGIPYVGAGKNIAEASSPVYMEAYGLKIAYVAASRAEKYILTPEAGENTPGVLRCYDTTRFVSAIKEARAKADYVIALPHWGTERSTVLEKAQTSSGHEYIDAGADIVIGAHSHCLQGMEYYKGHPIIYSLGNFWFDEFPEDTMVLEVDITGTLPGSGMSKSAVADASSHLETTVKVHPGTQTDLTTTMASNPAARSKILSRLEQISLNVAITEEGTVVPK